MLTLVSASAWPMGGSCSLRCCGGGPGRPPRRSPPRAGGTRTAHSTLATHNVQDRYYVNENADPYQSTHDTFKKLNIYNMICDDLNI